MNYIFYHDLSRIEIGMELKYTELSSKGFVYVVYACVRHECTWRTWQGTEIGLNEDELDSERMDGGWALYFIQKEKDPIRRGFYVKAVLSCNLSCRCLVLFVSSFLIRKLACRFRFYLFENSENTKKQTKIFNAGDHN